MRKTEALAKIKEYLEINAGQLVPEQILAIVENLGMKPPSVDELKRQAIVDVYYAGYTFNQWDEDFEKDEKVMEAYKRRKEFAGLSYIERKIKSREGTIARIQQMLDKAVSRSEKRRLGIILKDHKEGLELMKQEAQKEKSNG